MKQPNCWLTASSAFLFSIFVCRASAGREEFLTLTETKNDATRQPHDPGRWSASLLAYHVFTLESIRLSRKFTLHHPIHRLGHLHGILHT